MQRPLTPQRQVALIEEFLRDKGLKPKHAEVLELVAKMNGAPNWNKLQVRVDSGFRALDQNAAAAAGRPLKLKDSPKLASLQIRVHQHDDTFPQFSLVLPDSNGMTLGLSALSVSTIQEICATGVIRTGRVEFQRTDGRGIPAYASKDSFVAWAEAKGLRCVDALTVEATEVAEDAPEGLEFELRVSLELGLQVLQEVLEQATSAEIAEVVKARKAFSDQLARTAVAAQPGIAKVPPHYVPLRILANHYLDKFERFVLAVPTESGPGHHTYNLSVLDHDRFNLLSQKGIVAAGSVQHPRADRYGVPEYASNQGFSEWVREKLGLKCSPTVAVEVTDSEDDTPLRREFTLMVPPDVARSVVDACEATWPRGEGFHRLELQRSLREQGIPDDVLMGGGIGGDGKPLKVEALEALLRQHGEVLIVSGREAERQAKEAGAPGEIFIEDAVLTEHLRFLGTTGKGR